MKTLDEIQAAVDEIQQVCQKHGIALYGQCEGDDLNPRIRIVATIEYSGELQLLRFLRGNSYEINYIG